MASWAFTVRNSWSLVAGLALTSAPVLLLVGLVSASPLMKLGALVFALFFLALTFVQTALIAGFASHAYRHFTRPVSSSWAETFS